MSNNNVFKTTSLAVGDSATIVINDVKEGKFGPVYLGTVNGTTSEIRPSGNLKRELENASMGEALTITRTADVRTAKGFTATTFTVAKAGAEASNNVASKLAAIRAKRQQTQG